MAVQNRTICRSTGRDSLRASRAWKLNPSDRRLIRIALSEDLGPKRVDLTTHTLFGSSLRKTTARIFSKEPGPIRVCGRAVVEDVFRQLAPSCRLRAFIGEGEEAIKGQALFSVTGPESALLMGERTALNFVRRLTAIATLTRQFVDALEGTECNLLDTRKTTPGHRRMEKYAVTCGGGRNHRFGLFDAYMIKNNHVDRAGSMRAALEKILPHPQNRHPVVVEIRDEKELQEVIRWGVGKVDRVLLDNMTFAMYRKCVRISRGHFQTEASGGVTLGSVRKIAETGVDFISVGRVIYAAGNVDLSMHMDKNTTA